jgi:agmatine/peptidylarginine deiminase
MEMTMSTPRDDGFAMLAEWAPHQGCLMEWPHCITQQVPAGTLVSP